MATFGAVEPSPTAVADALRALDAILVEAVRWRDYPMVQNLVMFIAVVVVTQMRKKQQNDQASNIAYSSMK